jgi:predicted RNase H-like HicB family nuclease
VKDYHVNIFYSEEDEGYIADIPDLPCCSAFGETRAEALREVEIAKALWIEAAKDLGRPIPKPMYRPAIYQVRSAGFYRTAKSGNSFKKQVQIHKVESISKSSSINKGKISSKLGCSESAIKSESSRKTGKANTIAKTGIGNKCNQNKSKVSSKAHIK